MYYTLSVNQYCTPLLNCISICSVMKRLCSSLTSLVQPSGSAVRVAAFCPGTSVLASAGDDEVSPASVIRHDDA